MNYLSKMDKKEKFSEIVICDLFITPVIKDVGWIPLTQIHSEVTLTLGPIIVHSNMSLGDKRNLLSVLPWKWVFLLLLLMHKTLNIKHVESVFTH